MTARTCLPLLLLVLFSTPSDRAGSSHQPIEIKTAPATCFAPCDLRVIARIEPNPLNRWWVLQIDGEMFNGSVYPLGPDSPPTQSEIWYKGLTPGEYEITAVVYRAQEKSEAGRARSKLTVISSGPPEY